MARRVPDNAELIIVSPVDRDAVELFSTRRAFNSDGTIHYAQIIGNADALEAFARGEAVTAVEAQDKSGKQTARSLPRTIMERKLRRPLMDNELVIPVNGKSGDVRRSNLQLTDHSELSKVGRPSTWSSTGVKYVYPTPNDRFSVNYLGVYLGTYDTLDQASGVVESYLQLIDDGLSEEEAARRIKGMSRSITKAVIRD